MGQSGPGPFRQSFRVYPPHEGHMITGIIPDLAASTSTLHALRDILPVKMIINDIAQAQVDSIF